jgi:hypothetical protein
VINLGASQDVAVVKMSDSWTFQRSDPWFPRHRLLKNGCTEEEIVAGMEKASILRSDRRTTVHHLVTLEQVIKHPLNTKY